MILSKTVRLKPHGTQIQYFRDRGYVFSSKDEIDVNIEDLQPQSKITIHIACDLCGAEKDEKYGQYNKMISRGGYYVCLKCRQKKVIETNKKRYGGTTPFASKEVWDKALETMRNKYGADYSYQSPILKEKIHNTILEKYGCDVISQSPIIRDKAKKTNLEKYGFENVSQNKDIKEKVKKTLMEKYGVSCSLLLPEAREKATITNYKNGTICTSKQQRHICDLYNGVLNYPIGNYNVDMLIPKTNIIVEYNGGGHALDVVLGKTTYEDYRKNELKRYYFIKSKNYKQMFICSNYDYVPQDIVLEDMLSNATSLFSDNNWVEYNIDKGTIRYSNNKEGTIYDYGKLRKITKEDK